jgi:hypothetical protein
VVGVKPLLKRDDRRRREQRRDQEEEAATGREELIYHRSDRPFLFEQVDGSNESTTESVDGETGPKDASPEPRKVDVVV